MEDVKTTSTEKLDKIDDMLRDMPLYALNFVLEHLENKSEKKEQK